MVGPTPKRVLIVEDDALLRVPLSHRFAEAGYAVTEAADGEAGLAAFLAERPDAVVMDVSMPKLDGLGMLRAAREQAPDSRAAFIVLSNADDIERIADLTTEGASGYLLKSDRSLDGVLALVAERIGPAVEADPE